MNVYPPRQRVLWDLFGPWIAWFAIVLIGLWPHFVWPGTAGWAVTGVWLAMLTGLRIFFIVGSRRASR